MFRLPLSAILADSEGDPAIGQPGSGSQSAPADQTVHHQIAVIQLADSCGRERCYQRPFQGEASRRQLQVTGPADLYH
jgi:hypothetical protein